MAAGTDGASRGGEARAVWIVAVMAGDTGGVHLALQEGAILVDLSFHLPIRIIELLLQQSDPVCVHEGLPEDVVLAERRPARVAARAGLDFHPGKPGTAALRDAGLALHEPRAAVRVLEPDHQPHGAFRKASGPIPLPAGPGHVLRARSEESRVENNTRS